MNDVTPYLSSAEIRHLIPMSDAIGAMRRTFAAPFEQPARSVVGLPSGDLLVMPSAAGSLAGVKVLTVASSGRPVAIQGVYILFSAVDGRPRAVLDGVALTALRTPATSAVATDQLAKTSSESLGIVGTGVQARGHLEAMMEVRPGVSRVVIAGRHAQAVAEFCEAACTRFAIDAKSGTPQEVATSDIICCCTSTVSPVLPVNVQPGAHINAIGSYRPDCRELPGELVGKCQVFVDDVKAARAEAGDLIQAVSEGHWSWRELRGDLSALVAGGAAALRRDRPTLFKSVGLSIEDLAVAAIAADRRGIPP